MRENKIVVFANQKGGCGKTLLCTLFANYATQNNYPCCIIDADIQQSIYHRRLMDLNKFSQDMEMLAPYKVQAFDISNRSNVEKLMEVAKQQQGMVIFDTPGNVTQDGLKPIFLNADFIICPFLYDTDTLGSTGVFIRLLNEIKKQNPEMKAELIFVPNNIQKGVGLAEERKVWADADKLFANYGKLAPKVERKSCLPRYETFFLRLEQSNVVEETFKFILKQIYPRKR